MRMYDILNPFKLLCEERQQLDETLSTDFTIGFELEGVCTRDREPDAYLPSYHSADEPTGVVKELKDDLDRELGFGKGKIESDSSLNPSHAYDWTFEYGSPIIPFNPKNIEQIYTFLKKLPSLNVYTNNTCGFHTHFSYNYIDKKNAAWIMCCMAIDEKIFNELTVMTTENGIIPFTSHYADTGLFERLKEILVYLLPDAESRVERETYYNRLTTILTTNYNQKYQNVRVHPAGTLEWRGPRNFLNDADINKIHEYILKVYRVILTISKIVDSDTWSGSDITISKKEIMDNVTVSDTFASKEELRNERRKNPRAIIDVIKDDPKIVFRIPNKLLKTVTDNNTDEIQSIINNEYKISNEEWHNCSNNRLNMLLPLMNDGRMLELINWSFLHDDKENWIYNKIDAKQQERYRTELLYTFYMSEDKEIPSPIIQNNIIKINDESILNKIFDNIHGQSQMKLFIKKCIMLSNDFYISTPISIYKKILDMGYIYMLGDYDYIPPKIQRMMVRRNPYAVQYIRYIDSNILKSLKSKYPNIEDYIIGEY